MVVISRSCDEDDRKEHLMEMVLAHGYGLPKGDIDRDKTTVGGRI